ncbi:MULTISPECIES: IS4 family transposase [Moorena]|uniref:DDE domain transposase n=1 Tax=Moorena producens 3L TaxID=489825 RepID=F4Y305_9CYAN|nr:MULTISPECIES: IS4 family transposase [Moorena]EGJ28999.1 DDE domain transposase [Moorena producens 3L]NEP33982.1 IS4 family transposase [Moorena sp. SIO3B2]NEP69972.1 IS4 family transposase [Moorena sp. SIO3A5]NER91945.1 IS4 family transposase [Moorena sp. SIO3A2]OLT66613.1 transposase [Moorena producens 3L]
MSGHRKTHRDHAKKTQRPLVEDSAIAAKLESLVKPAITAQEGYYRKLGLRDRILNLPLMVAAVLTLLWRDVAGVRELNRILTREGFLWCSPTQVSQQAISQRFLTFPAQLFERVFKELLPELRKVWDSRKGRPLPESVQFTLSKFERIWIADNSTLEALFRKLKSLADIPQGQLAGKMGVVVDVKTRLPVEIWFEENPRASDTKLESNLLNLVRAKTLLLLARGFYHFYFWQQLIDRGIHFITRLKKGASLEVKQVFSDSYSLRDRLIRMGSGTKKTPFVTLRLIEVRSGKTWHSYLTSVLDPMILPPYVVADLYGRRWRIEEAFNTVKRLLGLSYLWTGSLNGVKLQIWGTWLFYAVLVDLGDAVASELSLPFDRISLEMIYRGLYHFYVAHDKGLASDPVKYFAAPENQDLGIVKQQRKPKVKLIVAPFPDRQKGQSEFFFKPFSSTPLTIGIQA